MSEFLQVIIPDSGQDLLRQEVALGFSGAGLEVLRIHPLHLQDPKHSFFLPHLLTKPTLLFSINGQGLTPMRPVLEALRKANSMACIWFVDNPWNILAGVLDPLWKKLPLFVTDKNFVDSLTACGAEFVMPLPLAACFELFSPQSARDSAFPAPDDLAPFVFVGRSSFPGKDIFFKGCSLPEKDMAEAKNMLTAGGRPDFSWWQKKLCADPTTFWPGKKARQVSYCAEESSLLWRTMVLEFIVKTVAENTALLGDQRDSSYCALDVFGDAGWTQFLPAKSRLRPAVDYYARLPAIYTKAQCNVALTSLQLPCALNQRHFDVWAAGGLCLSDNTPGLDIFPKELVEPIIFHDQVSFQEKAQALFESATLRKKLISGWQDCLRNGHTYAHRVRAVLDVLSGCHFDV